MMLPFKTIADFLSMGGYAHYVWPAYGIVMTVLLWNVILPLQRQRRLQRQGQR